MDIIIASKTRINSLKYIYPKSITVIIYSTYYAEELLPLKKTFSEFQKVKINQEEQMLGLEMQTEYRQIDEMAAQKDRFDKLWSTVVTFHEAHDRWMNGPLLEVNAEDVEEGVSCALNDTMGSF